LPFEKLIFCNCQPVGDNNREIVVPMTLNLLITYFVTIVCL